MHALLCALFAAAASGPAAPPGWTRLAEGVEHARLPFVEKPLDGDGLLDVVRIDPRRASLSVVLAAPGDLSATAQAWARARGLVAVINAGMYAADHRTHVGYARGGKEARTKEWKESYSSALVFGPRNAGLPQAALIDLDAPGAKERCGQYETVLQNLRLVKRDKVGQGVNVWKENGHAWSEAAVAEDDQGRILFLFARAPLSMKQFGDRLLALGLGIVRAQHLEGGPEASLSVHAAGVEHDYHGCLETGFIEDAKASSCKAQWVLPNVLGVAASSTPAGAP